MELEKLKPIIEALLCAADGPLSVNHLYDLFTGDLDQPGKDDIRKVLHELVEEYQGKGLEIKQVASGFRLQVNPDYSTWITRLFQQKPPRYSRALLETLALIAYRQPVTRGEIEAIRGVSVSTNIIKTLQEREWVKTLGHKDVPGRPSLYGTTNEFLDYFNLKSLNELPTLSELKDLDQFHPELALNDGVIPAEVKEEVNSDKNTELDFGNETNEQEISGQEETEQEETEQEETEQEETEQEETEQEEVAAK